MKVSHEVDKRPTLNKQRLIRRIGQQTHLPNALLSDTMDAFIEIVTDELGSGGRVEIANFLILEARARTRVRIARIQPSSQFTLTPIRETFYTIRCRPGQHLRQRLRALSKTKTRGQ